MPQTIRPGLRSDPHPRILRTGMHHPNAERRSAESELNVGRAAPKSMRRIFDKIVFRLRQYAWIAQARLRTLWWKMLGMKVGARTLLPPIRVTWPHQVSVGAQCLLEHGIYFKFDGPWRPGPSILIADGTFIGVGCEFNIQNNILIGSHCRIASGCRFFDHDHETSTRNLPTVATSENSRVSPIILNEAVWLGAGVVVLRGVTIGRGAIVGAGAVVTKSIGEFEIWAGVPARKIGIRPN